jgi:hypothetical protein
MRFIHIAEEAGLDNSLTRQRLNRLQADGLVARTGPRHGDPYALTDAVRALGPVYTAVERWSNSVATRKHSVPPAPRHGGHPDPHRRPAGVGRHPDRSGPAPEHRRAERPLQSRTAAATAGTGSRRRPVGPSSGPVIRVALRASRVLPLPRRPRAVKQPAALRTRARSPPAPPEFRL